MNVQEEYPHEREEDAPPSPTELRQVLTAQRQFHEYKRLLIEGCSNVVANEPDREHC